MVKSNLLARLKDLVSLPFLFGLVILLLNDFYLKHHFSGWITGKLSDFAGLFIFPMFLTVLIPRYKKANYLFTFIAFILWKLPVAESTINAFNSMNWLTINRVIDYTDYVALSVLPLSYFLNLKPIAFPAKKMIGYTVGATSIFAFCATAGTHGSMGGYQYPISKDSLEVAIDQLIDEHPEIIRSPNDTTDYHNKDAYVTMYLQNDTALEYTFRYYGGEEHWEQSPNQSAISITYGRYEGKTYSEGGGVSRRIKKRLVAYFEKNFIRHLDHKLGLKHVKKD